MSIGAFGENFPYTNFHDLNMDWIIKIAKDFLDQYTHIQELIAQGEADISNLTEESLTSLQDKYDTLKGLLDLWYEQHSEDIADQLADALDDLDEWYTQHQDYLDETLQTNITTFQTRVAEIVAVAVASIPSDYSDFYGNALKWMRYLTSSDDVLDLPVGVYAIGSSHPTGVPTDYPATGTGLVIVFDKAGTGNVPLYRIIFTGYSHRMWYHTGYQWNELATKADVSTIVQTFSYYHYISALDTNTDPRTADEGLYNLIPANTYLNLPANYNHSNYGWCFVMKKSATAPFIILTDGVNVWYTVSGTAWRPLTSYNTITEENICLFGDSLTEYNNTASNNWAKLMENCGFHIQNLAHGGTGFANPGVTGKYADFIENINNNTTLIGVSGSFNDLSSSVGLPVGEVTDTGTSSLCGYMNDFFTALTTQFPTIPIVCYTMPPWGTLNYTNTLAKQYNTKLEEICKRNNIPFKSLLTCSTLRPWQESNRQYYYGSDAIHPNNEGHKLIFRHLLPLFMESAKNPYDMYKSIAIFNN